MVSFNFNDLPLEIKESICLKLESDAFMMFNQMIDFSTRKIERRLQQERRKQLKNQSESNQSVLDVPLFFGAWTQEHTQALSRSWEKAYGDCSQEELRECPMFFGEMRHE